MAAHIGNFAGSTLHLLSWYCYVLWLSNLHVDMGQAPTRLVQMAANLSPAQPRETRWWCYWCQLRQTFCCEHDPITADVIPALPNECTLDVCGRLSIKQESLPCQHLISVWWIDLSANSDFKHCQLLSCASLHCPLRSLCWCAGATMCC